MTEPNPQMVKFYRNVTALCEAMKQYETSLSLVNSAKAANQRALEYTSGLDLARVQSEQRANIAKYGTHLEVALNKANEAFAMLKDSLKDEKPPKKPRKSKNA